MKAANKIVLCLDSKFEGGRIQTPQHFGHLRLCLDSKFEGGRIKPKPPAEKTSLCLDSKFEGGRIAESNRLRNRRLGQRLYQNCACSGSSSGGTALAGEP